jgi:hypothetical protein
MLTRIALSVAIGLATLVPAHAQLPRIGHDGPWMYFYWPDGGVTAHPTIIVLAAVVGAVLLLAWLANQGNRSSPCSCDECVAKRARSAAERHDREAARLRAQSRQTEAHTELMASQIDNARVGAEYGELRQITDHDRRIRNIHRSGR